MESICHSTRKEELTLVEWLPLKFRALAKELLPPEARKVSELERVMASELRWL